ncbi:hypothetical protein BpHYR1_007852 [Brachionus plicatilis]|uniref:Uncharacterized protein n=1 Tax=Brachionus plicatilis TaxID=10195 RepID=A0A3M7SWQ5_BRAPC|nr:hypothetical protein BpHYR1_007852 [Brachionus plicatilis]
MTKSPHSNLSTESTTRLGGKAWSAWRPCLCIKSTKQSTHCCLGCEWSKSELNESMNTKLAACISKLDGGTQRIKSSVTRMQRSLTLKSSIASVCSSISLKSSEFRFGAGHQISVKRFLSAADSSFLPKSPDGFMVADKRKFSSARILWLSVMFSASSSVFSSSSTEFNRSRTESSASDISSMRKS